MVKLNFLGRLFPLTNQVTFLYSGIRTKILPDLDLYVDFRVGSVGTVINVECVIERFEESLFLPLFQQALFVARICVDMTAFANGHGVTVVLETVLYPNGLPSPIRSETSYFPQNCTAYDLTPARRSDFHQIINMVVVEPVLALALHELVESISVPFVSVVNCARVVERLRHLVAPAESDENRQWEILRKELRVQKSYLKFITDASRESRHGKPVQIAGDVTEQVVRRAAIVLNRYFEYRRRGNQLPPDEFPVLDS